VSDHPAQSERLRTAMSKAKQGIGRLIDAYTAGLVETSDFEPRIKRLKERLTKLEVEWHQLAQQIQEQRELQVLFRAFGKNEFMSSETSDRSLSNLVREKLLEYL
jgi:hypothetical protein